MCKQSDGTCECNHDRFLAWYAGQALMALGKAGVLSNWGEEQIAVKAFNLAVAMTAEFRKRTGA